MPRCYWDRGAGCDRTGRGSLLWFEMSAAVLATAAALIFLSGFVRPFVTHRMIEENIQAAMAYGACDTVIPATDTIVESKDHQNISCIPERSTMYLGQTPQSFKAKKLRDIYLNMTEEEKEILTDACKIMVLKGEQVRLVEGDVTNIKITYPSDIRMAESLLGGK